MVFQSLSISTHPSCPNQGLNCSTLPSPGRHCPTDGSMPKKVWPKSADAVQEWEVLLYAFIVLKFLFPVLPGSRKRRRGSDESVSLEKLEGLTNVTGLFVQDVKWWEDIALALSFHPVTKVKPHLCSAPGLNSWFVNGRGSTKTKIKGSSFRDAHCSERWKD